MHNSTGHIGSEAPGRLRASRLVVVLWAATCALAGAAAQPVAAAESKGPMPLVEVDDELAGYLSDARRLAGEGHHHRAIEILQALIDRDEGGFVDVGGGRCVGLGVAANRVIGEMSPAGVKAYRSLYDGQAARLYEKARRTGATALLRRITHQYLHSSYAGRAFNDLGAVCFDGGGFAQAGRCWHKALELRTSASAEPVLLAKIAVAQHFSGQAAEARKTAAALKTRFGGAEGRLGGRRRRLAEFVAQTLAMRPRAAQGTRVVRDWPGLGGLGDGLAVMPDCRIVLVTGWATSPVDATGKFHLSAGRTQRALGIAKSSSPRLYRGHVRISVAKKSVYLNPAVHPVIAGGAVVHRTDDGVVALDLLTGEVVWKLLLALEWKPPGRSGDYYYYGRSESKAALADPGLYMLTAGGGKIFVRYGFLSVWYGRQRKAPDRSALAAVEADTGRRLWRIGSGRGDEKIIRAGKFVSPPTWHAGRLYAIVLHVASYHMVCLDADTGRTLWRTEICQAPVVSGSYGRRPSAWVRDRCSPPAVADGKVLALPNVGVVVALGAETGRPLWAFHYKSDLNVRPARRYLRTPARSLNPILVVRGRVVCLPADSDFLVAVSADDGRPVWPRSVGRDGQFDLSAVATDRVLLSGPGLGIVSVSDGRLKRFPEAEGILGRPAVTDAKVLACGRGRLYQLDLKTGKLTATQLADPSGLLGNLVSTRGALLAANAAGVCAYFGFDAGRAQFDKRIKQAAARDRAKLLLLRGRFTFCAGRYPKALEDLKSSRRLAAALDEKQLLKEVTALTCRTYVALGNEAKTPGEMLELFRKALADAAGPEEQARMQLRLAKCHVRLGKPAVAVAIARRIAGKFADVQMADVAIGPEANVLARPDPERAGGAAVSREFIRRLIARHGPGVYARFDREARAALEKARAAADPAGMCAVRDLWPNSVWADDAIFAAAELYYVRAVAAEGEQADELFGRAMEQLSEVASMPDSPLRASANVALAAIFTRAKREVPAGLMLDRVRRAPKNTPVKFADIRGKLGDIEAELRAGRLPGVQRR